MENINCIHCNEPVGLWPAGEICGNAYDDYREQLSRDHQCRELLEYTCRDCGEIYATCDPGYQEEYPNGSDMFLSQKLEEHQEVCGREHEHTCELPPVHTCTRPKRNTNFARGRR